MTPTAKNAWYHSPSLVQCNASDIKMIASMLLHWDQSRLRAKISSYTENFNRKDRNAILQANAQLLLLNSDDGTSPHFDFLFDDDDCSIDDKDDEVTDFGLHGLTVGDVKQISNTLWDKVLRQDLLEFTSKNHCIVIETNDTC